MDGMGAGLLGFDYNEEMKRQRALALIQAGLTFAGARKGQELQMLGPAFASGVGTYLAGSENARRNAMDSAKLKMYQQEQDDKQAAARAAADYAQRMSGAFSGGPDLSQMGAGGPTPENAVRVTPDKIAQYQKAAEIAAAAGRTEDAKRLSEIAEKFKKKFSQTPQIGIDPQTRQPYHYVLDDEGNEKRLGAGVAPKFREIQRGGSVDVVNEFNLPSSGQSFGVTMNPYQSASLGLEREKFNYQQKKDSEKGVGDVRPTWDPTSGQFVFAPTEKNPRGTAVQPEGYMAKPPEHTRREIDSLDAQINIVDGARAAAKSNPDAFGFSRGLATMSGTIPESIASKASTPENRQARAYVYNVVSAAINERAGAAQSVQELARLRSFLPAETDNAKEIEDKLNGFEQYLKDKRKAYAGKTRAAQDDPLGLR